MALSIKVKTFDELNTKTLYDLLQLRSEVFVVEQQCVYQDLDYKDQNALHILLYDDNELIGYSRAFKQGDYFDQCSIGRVVVRKEARKSKHGYVLMEATIKAIEEHFNSTLIKISAQTYLTKFYNNLGFRAIGQPYLEDDIPHIAMIRD